MPPPFTLLMISRFIFGLIFGLSFGGMGYFVAFFAGKPILDNANQSADWPAVPGVIERSEVVTKHDSDGTMYSANIVYGYRVEDQYYQGSTVSFGGNFSSSSSRSAYKLKGRYPHGKNIDVYYDPEEPPNSVLEPGATWKSWIVFGIGLLFLSIGVIAGAVPIFSVLFAALLAGSAVAGKRS